MIEFRTFFFLNYSDGIGFNINMCDTMKNDIIYIEKMKHI